MSIVEYFSEHSGYKCGYCGSEDTNFSHGMWAHALTTRDYQELIDRGWRRSGQYCYKPTMDRTCCPLYTIKCQALGFKPTKSQKKVVKKFINYILHDKKPSGHDQTDMEADMKPVTENVEETEQFEKSVLLKDVAGLLNQGNDNTVDNKMKEVEKKTSDKQPICDRKPSESDVSQPVGQDPEKQKQGKAKLRRLEKWKAKHPDEVLLSKEEKNQEKSIEDLLQSLETSKSTSKHKWEMKLVKADSDNEAFNASLAETVALYQKYQRIIHNDSPDKCTEKQFKRFLCNSPLGGDGMEGSYHYQYRIDSKIVAVGVLDILPHCVSSVYLYYDPDYHFLSLGTLTSLLEICLVRKLAVSFPSISNYYLGFYIHTCVKMRYKARYSPSFLLCPESFTWQPLEACRALLEKSPYSRLTPDTTATDREAVTDLAEVGVLCSRQAIHYNTFKRLLEEEEEDQDRDEEEVTEYSNLVGNSLARRMLLYRTL